MDVPVYLINLDRSPERLAFMQEQAERLGITMQRIPAIDGLNVPLRFRPQFLTPDGKALSGLPPGKLGNYCSQLIACERILESDLPWAVILEDDVHLDDDFAEVVTSAVAAVPQWDVIHLSSDVKKAVLSVAEITEGRHLVRYSRFTVNAGAYIVSASGAQKMLVPKLRLNPNDIDRFRYGYLMGIDFFGRRSRARPAKRRPAQRNRRFRQDPHIAWMGRVPRGQRTSHAQARHLAQLQGPDKASVQSMRADRQGWTKETWGR